MAAMVNPTMMNPLQVKDSRWLTLEVCREFTRQKCTRPDTECKFAHPPPHVEVQNGRVTCCFDSIKGKCQRKDPPCKYLHPPQHLREQLLQNGRNNLILKNLQMQAMAAGLSPAVHLQGVIPTQIMYDGGGGGMKSHYASAASASHLATAMPGQYPLVQAHPYLQMQTAATFSPYMSPSTLQGGVMSAIDASNAALSGAAANQVAANVMPSHGVAAAQQKVSRADRLEPTSSTTASCGTEATWTGSYVDSLAPSSQYSHVYFQGVPGVPGVVPVVKRPAMADSKSGIPVYQPGGGTAAAYQQAALAAMQLQQQPFVPVSIAGHPPSVPRF